MLDADPLPQTSRPIRRKNMQISSLPSRRGPAMLRNTFGTTTRSPFQPGWVAEPSSSCARRGPRRILPRFSCRWGTANSSDPSRSPQRCGSSSHRGRWPLVLPIESSRFGQVCGKHLISPSGRTAKCAGSNDPIHLKALRAAGAAARELRRPSCSADILLMTIRPCRYPGCGTGGAPPANEG